MALALTVVCLFTMKAHAGPDGCEFVYRAPTPVGFHLSVEELTQFLFYGFPLKPLRPDAQITAVYAFASGAEACAARRTSIRCVSSWLGGIWVIDAGPCRSVLLGGRGGVITSPACEFVVEDDFRSYGFGSP